MATGQPTEIGTLGASGQTTGFQGPCFALKLHSYVLVVTGVCGTWKVDTNNAVCNSDS